MFYLERIPKKERTPEFQEKLFEFLHQGDQATKPIRDVQRKVVAQHLGISVESLTDEKLMAETGKILFEAPESKAAQTILKQNIKMGTQQFPRMQKFLKSLSPDARKGIFQAIEDIQSITMRQLAPVMEKKFPGIDMAELQKEAKLSPKAQRVILETSPNVLQQYLEKGIKLLPKIFGEEQGKVFGSTFLGNVVNRIGNLVTDAMQGLLKFIR